MVLIYNNNNKVYCGDNQNIPPEYDERGTRYTCLRRGIGVGLNLEGRRPPGIAPDGTVLPRDPNRRKEYCGTKDDLPDGYDGFATNYTCLKKGVGVGLWKRYDEDPNFFI